MIEKEFLPYEESLKLKELGFNEPCVYYVDKDNNSYIYNFQTHPDEFIEGCGVNVIPTPTFSQVFRWFRGKHKLDSTVALVAIGYGFYIHKNRNYTNKGENYGMHITYEEAELACLKKLIEIVKNNKL